MSTNKKQQQKNKIQSTALTVFAYFGKDSNEQRKSSRISVGKV